MQENVGTQQKREHQMSVFKLSFSLNCITFYSLGYNNNIADCHIPEEFGELRAYVPEKHLQTMWVSAQRKKLFSHKT